MKLSTLLATLAFGLAVLACDIPNLSQLNNPADAQAANYDPTASANNPAFEMFYAYDDNNADPLIHQLKFNPKTGEASVVATPYSLGGQLSGLYPAPNGHLVAMIRGSNLVIVKIDPATGEMIYNFWGAWMGISGIPQAAFSADGQWLVVWVSDPNINQTDLYLYKAPVAPATTWTQINNTTVPREIDSLVFAHNSSRFYLTGHEGTAVTIAFHINSDGTFASTDLPSGFASPSKMKLLVDPQDRYVYAINVEGQIVSFEITSGGLADGSTYQLTNPPGIVGTLALSTDTNSPLWPVHQQMIFHPNGSHLYLVGKVFAAPDVPSFWHLKPDYSNHGLPVLVEAKALDMPAQDFFVNNAGTLGAYYSTSMKSFKIDPVTGKWSNTPLTTITYSNQTSPTFSARGNYMATFVMAGSVAPFQGQFTFWDLRDGSQRSPVDMGFSSNTQGSGNITVPPFLSYYP